MTFSRHNTGATNETSTEIVDNVTIEIWHHHDIELPWVRHHLAQHTEYWSTFTILFHTSLVFILMPRVMVIPIEFCCGVYYK